MFELKEETLKKIGLFKPKEKDTKKKLAIICLKGLDNFMQWIDHLDESRFEVRKCIVEKENEIEEAITWADIVWFEWMNQSAIYGTTFRGTQFKDNVIIHCHSYEVLSGFPQQIGWQDVDKVVYVAEHVKRVCLDQLPDKLPRKIEHLVIPNGVDLDKYTFQEREHGNNIAFVGYINHKKGPMLLLHAMREIADKYPEKILHIAGKHQDPRFEAYFKQNIGTMGLLKHIEFHGWVKEMDDFLKDMNYVICTSPWESQGMGIMEAMACGIKPLVHNFYGAKYVYSPLHLWNTLESLLDMMTDSYTSARYRKYVEERYSLEKQVKAIEEIL